MRLIPLRFSPRTRSIIWTALGIVALAGVILGLSAISKPKTPMPTPSVTVSEAGGANLLATRAQDALSRGDTETAKGLADKALGRDSGNVMARKVVDTIESASNPDSSSDADPSQSGTTSSTSSSAKPKPVAKTPALFFGSVKDLATLLPKKVSGYDPAMVVKEGSVAQVTMDPAAGGAADGHVRRVLLTVHDFKTTKAAAAFSSGTASKVFSKSASKVSLGDVQARFGTDGRLLASVQFSRGRYAFEAVLTADSRDPAELRSLAVTIAKSFPTKP